MTPSVALRLGRVSNLPTVWTNALAGVALAGASPWQWAVLPAALGLSLAYLGGMYLNDAFDSAIDARERPSRPIPSGAIEANTVFALGFALLLAAVAVLAAAARGFDAPPEAAVLGGLALGGAIIGYNWNHKGNRFSPLTMAVCRLLAYVVAGLAATATVPGPLLAASAVSLCYLIGLTYIAKRRRWAGSAACGRCCSWRRPWPTALCSPGGRPGRSCLWRSPGGSGWRCGCCAAAGRATSPVPWCR